MKKIIKRTLLVILSAGLSLNVMASTRVTGGQKIIVDNFVYIVDDWYNPETQKREHIVELRGVTDAFYMPSLLKVPDKITYEGENMMVYSINGSKYDAENEYIPFEGSNDIVKVESGKNVKKICGFNGCKELTSAKLNQGLKTIGWGAFQNTLLTSIELPSTLETIDVNAFAGTPLGSVTIPPSVKEIGNGAFNCESISEMIFTPCDTAFTEPWLVIGNCMGANQNYGKLRSITLPAHLKHVNPTSFCKPPVEEYKVAEGCLNYFAIDGVLYENGDTITAYSYPLGRTAETWIAPKELSGGKIAKQFYDNNSNIGTPTCQLKSLDFSQLDKPIKICSEAFSQPDFELLDLQNIYEIEDDAFDWGGVRRINISADLVKIGPGKICMGNPLFTVDPANPFYTAWEGSLCKNLPNGNLQLIQYHNPSPYNECVVTIPENIVSIGEKAFYGLNKIKEINLPSTLRSIESRAFEFANDLSKITCNSRVVDYVSAKAFGMYGEPPVIKSFKGDAFMIGNWLFRWCSKIDNPKSIKIPNETTIIGEGAFSKHYTGDPNSYWNTDRFDNLTSIKIPDQIIRIEKCAFLATPLESVTLPLNLKKIGAYAFSSTQLTSLALPARLDTINNNAFTNCQLEEITIPERTKHIGESAFQRNPAKKLTVGRANSAFETVVGNYAFSNLANIEVVYIGNNVVSIGSGAFQSLAQNSPAPVEIELDGVREIGSYAFSGANIEKITIGSSLERIHSYALNVKHNIDYDYESGEWPAPIIDGSSTLKTLTIATANPPQFVKEHEEQAEQLCEDVVYALCTLTIPAGSENAYKASTAWSPFILLNADNWISTSIESAAANASESTCTLSGRSLKIAAAGNTPVTVATANGRILFQGYGSATVEVIPGIVIVRMGSTAQKYIVR